MKSSDPARSPATAISIDAVSSVLKTNLYLEDRYALSMRLDPRFLEDDSRPERPFGVFFVHGRGFNGFHVRFRDVSRGGLRVVLPATEEAHTAESRRHFNECFRLAWAQYLKNVRLSLCLDPQACALLLAHHGAHTRE